jgi:hypothetical protein
MWTMDPFDMGLSSDARTPSGIFKCPLNRRRSQPVCMPVRLADEKVRYKSSTLSKNSIRIPAAFDIGTYFCRVSDNPRPSAAIPGSVKLLTRGFKVLSRLPIDMASLTTSRPCFHRFHELSIW